MTASDSMIELVPPALIERWEVEYAALGKDVERIEERRSTIKIMIDAARSLMPPPGVPQPSPASRPAQQSVGRPKRRRPRGRVAAKPRAASPSRSSAIPPLAPKPRRQEKSEWTQVLRLITLTADHPVSYAEARQEIMKMPELAPKLEKSDKGFFYGIRKLTEAGEAVSYKAHLFVPEMFRKFKDDLDAGRVRDIRVANAAHQSPMGEVMLKVLSQRRAGAESGHLIWELRKNPEFAAAIDKNKTHPYNVLKRLVDRKDIVKRGKRYYYAPFPGNEAPPKLEGAPITSESQDAAKGSLLG